MNYHALLLAQADATDQSVPQGDAADTATETTGQQTTEPDQPETPQPDAKPKSLGPWVPLLLMFVVLYFLMFRGPKKKQKKHQEMLDSMQKGVRVRTIGGIIGTVVDLRDDEIVIKVDESNNTKMRLVRSAISKVLTEEEKASQS